MSVLPNGGLSMRQMAHVVGRLDVIDPSTRKFTLHLDDGFKAGCVLVEGDVSELAKHLGQRLAVEGMAVYELSGRLVRIEVDHFAPGAEEPSAHTRIPVPLSKFDLPPEAPTPRPWGLEATFGTWPGDETDEELLKMLEELG
jgi:hypothetical protein